jgi:hypothetical protein
MASITDVSQRKQPPFQARFLAPRNRFVNQYFWLRSDWQRPRLNTSEAPMFGSSAWPTSFARRRPASRSHLDRTGSTR